MQNIDATQPVAEHVGDTNILLLVLAGLGIWMLIEVGRFLLGKDD